MTPGPALVGQAIEVRVEIDGPATDRRPPRLAGSDATLHRVESGPSASRFVVVPLRPGPLVIPPSGPKSGDRSGASGPIRLAVANLPAEGRAHDAPGGVGTFDVGRGNSERVRLGESLEYRITLTGPAAWGSDLPPNLVGWSKSDPGLRVEPRPVEPPGATRRRGLPLPGPAGSGRSRRSPAGRGRRVRPAVAELRDPDHPERADRGGRTAPARPEPPGVRLEGGEVVAGASGRSPDSGWCWRSPSALRSRRRRWGRTRRPVPARGSHVS